MITIEHTMVRSTPLSTTLETFERSDDMVSVDYLANCARLPYVLYGGNNCKVVGTLHNTSLRNTVVESYES
mgnify:CR=1 FL=1